MSEDDPDNGLDEEYVEDDLDETDFNEATYLTAFPDIAEAVRRGVLESGLAHYRSLGRAEGRLEKPEYRALLHGRAGAAPSPVSIDTLTVSRSGAVLMTGWTDDRQDPLTRIALEMGEAESHVWTAFPRLPRADVRREVGIAVKPHPFGFLLVGAPRRGVPRDGAGETAGIDPDAVRAPVFHFASGAEDAVQHDPVVTSDTALRDMALAALPIAAAEGDPASLHALLDQHVGVQVAALNRAIVERAHASRLVERVGSPRARYRASVVTSLRGRADQLVPRLTLIATGAGAEEHEHIFVVTEADQFEPALRAAHVAEKTLGLPLTLVFQPDGDAAGAGEDAASDIARSDRLIFMDQTVYPRDPDWAFRHAAILSGAPEAQTRLFGGLLYGLDGSLAHGGYYFDRETGLLSRPGLAPGRVVRTRVRRVTHPAPGALPALRKAHPVAALPAAFLSADRSWFEQLGRFTHTYVRAAYDDIDLCLRAMKDGVPAWVHPLAFWYFERRAPLKPEPGRGGTLFNDWLFHRQWDEQILSTLPNAGG